MKEYLAQHRIDPRDALHTAGAAHTASDVEEFGVGSDKRWDIPPRTKTPWLYGLIPSSYAAIDHQFGFPAGTVTLSDASWQKAQRGLSLKPFVLTKAGKTPSKKAAPAPTPAPPAAPPTPAVARLLDYLTKPPHLASEDEEQLLLWSTGVVALARKNGYLSTTADSIAVYHTAMLLAQLRNRTHPTAYDFRDAAITCLEKDRVPGKRSIRHVCEILLGGDRSGQVGYTSLPPLAQDVYTRLEPLRLNLTATSIQRALMDFRLKPELLPCSDLLWKLHYLLQQQQLFRPIMGERKLGHVPTQESWDISLGKNQTPLIMLGYEGVTVEQVLERKLKTRAFATDAKTLDALAAAEDCLLYLKSPRLTEEIGSHAVGLLVEETGAQSAPEIFERVRRLVHYYRSTPTGLPDWIKRFVTTGYSHYATLLPAAFSDRGTTPDQIASMLAFVFTLESLALSLGSSRSQLLIAVQQTGPVTDDPNKIGMLWAAEVLLGLRTLDAIRVFFDHLLENRLALPSFPAYVNGFLLALKFTPLVARLVVELVSRAFEKLPDTVLMPWLPGLIMTLRPHADTLLPTLLKEAATCYPDKLAALAKWTLPWAAAPPAATAGAAPAAGAAETLSEPEKMVQALLFAEPATANALAVLLGLPPEWQQPTAASGGQGAAAQGAASGTEAAVQALLQAEPATMTALRELWRG